MSDQETTKNFLEVMASFVWPEPKPLFYRLYYNDDGTPNFYSREDLPGKYIEVDQEIYSNKPFNIRVVDGKLEFIKPVVLIQQLVRSHTGTACHTNDVTVVVEENQPHIKWTKINNEIN